MTTFLIGLAIFLKITLGMILTGAMLAIGFKLGQVAMLKFALKHPSLSIVAAV